MSREHNEVACAQEGNRPASSCNLPRDHRTLALEATAAWRGRYDGHDIRRSVHRHARHPAVAGARGVRYLSREQRTLVRRAGRCTSASRRSRARRSLRRSTSAAGGLSPRAVVIDERTKRSRVSRMDEPARLIDHSVATASLVRRGRWQERRESAGSRRGVRAAMRRVRADRSRDPSLLPRDRDVAAPRRAPTRPTTGIARRRCNRSRS